MFRKITVVRLSGSDPLLDYTLPWPSKNHQPIDARGDISLLQHANVLPKGNFSQYLMDKDNAQGFSTIILPIHYQVSGQQSEIIADLNKKEYDDLSLLLSAVLTIKKSNGVYYWYAKEQLVDHDLKDQYQINTDSKQAKLLQEIEMMLYAHPVNQKRSQHQQATISGVSLGSVVGSYRVQHPVIVSDAAIANLFSVPTPLFQWIKSPKTGVTLIIGRETGDREWYPVQKVLTHLLDKGVCNVLEIIEPFKKTTYTTSRFYNVYTRLF